MGAGIRKLWATEGTELPVEQVKLAVEARSNQLVLGLAAPPEAGLWSRVGHQVLLLEGLNRADLLQERPVFMGDCTAPSQELGERRAPHHLKHGRFQEGLDGLGTPSEPPATTKPAVAAQRLDRPSLGLPVVGVHAHAAVATAQQAAPQMPGGMHRIGLALWVGQQRAQGVVGVLGEDRRPGRWVDVFAVDAESSHVWSDQDPPQRGRGPPATGRGGHAARIQVKAQRRQRLTSEDAAGQLVDDRRLGRLNGTEVTPVAVAPRATMRSS
jgi:hypothetical protein